MHFLAWIELRWGQRLIVAVFSGPRGYVPASKLTHYQQLTTDPPPPSPHLTATPVGPGTRRHSYTPGAQPVVTMALPCFQVSVRFSIRGLSNRFWRPVIWTGVSVRKRETRRDWWWCCTASRASIRHTLMHMFKQGQTWGSASTTWEHSVMNKEMSFLALSTVLDYSFASLPFHSDIFTNVVQLSNCGALFWPDSYRWEGWSQDNLLCVSVGGRVRYMAPAIVKNVTDFCSRPFRVVNHCTSAESFLYGKT